MALHYGDPAPAVSRAWPGPQPFVCKLSVSLEGQVSDQAGGGHTTTQPGLLLSPLAEHRSGERAKTGLVFPPRPSSRPLRALACCFSFSRTSVLWKCVRTCLEGSSRDCGQAIFFTCTSSIPIV